MILSLGIGIFMNIGISEYSISLENKGNTTAIQQYINQIIENKHIEVIRSIDRTVDFPDRAKPDINYEHQDASYRINTVLPYREDKDRNAYIVYPKLGVIVPVLGISDKDKQLVHEKKGFDHYVYLQRGSLHYVGYSPSQGDDNMVIAGHSSFYTNDTGKYKTAFQVVALSNIGDNIWYFEKNADGNYDRYDYAIDVIDQVSAKDTSILYPRGNGKELTTYTCYPFGSTVNRKYNKATFIGKRDGTNKVIYHQPIHDTILHSKKEGSEPKKGHAIAPQLVKNENEKKGKKRKKLEFRKSKILETAILKKTKNKIISL